MRLTNEQSVVFSRVALQVARTFRRMHPWLSLEEMQGEAWVAMLEALPHFDPALGELGGYLHRIAARSVKSLCWRLSVAANVPERRTTPQTLARVRAATVQDDALVEVPSTDQGAEASLAEAEEREVLAEAVARLLAKGREGEAIKAVLYGEAKSKEAAEKYGVPVSVVYQGTFYARRALAEDRRVQELR